MMIFVFFAIFGAIFTAIASEIATLKSVVYEDD